MREIVYKIREIVYKIREIVIQDTTINVASVYYVGDSSLHTEADLHKSKRSSAWWPPDSRGPKFTIKTGCGMRLI